MPPKQPSKTELAKKQKIVEDKTFGLKNKNKSKNVQKYVQNLKQSVQPKPDSSKVAQKKKKEEEKAKEKELNDLFKIAVTQPKVPVGVDPKSIVCEFYKVGQCAKGFKCKFSHDLNVQRKGEKIDIYSDKRDQETMEDWDQETLEKVVESKTKEYNQNKPTDIVCKYFLEAVEKKQYGWFWVCPNGGKDCHYRHALPPGYVLKSQMKALIEEEREKTPIEDEIENQRAKLKTSTPMTPELFIEWKKKKIAERDESLAAQKAERAKNDRMSGRELFMSDASLFVDDAEAYEKYQREEESDVAGNKANPDSAADGPSTSATSAADAEALPDDDDDDDDDDESDVGDGSCALTREDYGVNHLLEGHVAKSFDESRFDPCFQQTNKVSGIGEDFNVQDDSCMSFEFQPNMVDSLSVIDTKANSHVNGVKTDNCLRGRLDGSSDLAHHVYLFDSCDTKIWDTRYPTAPTKGIDLQPTCNIIEEIFGQDTRDNKTRIE